jgi:hypothetical protein
VVVLLALTAASSFAQEDQTLKKIQSLNLPYSAKKIKAYYSPGYEKRSLETQELLAEAAAFFEKNLDLKLDLTVAVLDEETWKKAVGESPPYGFPFVTSAPSVAFFPATDNNAIALLSLSLKDRVPPAVMKEFDKIGLTYEEASRRFVTLTGLHELGHTYTEVSQINPGNKWFSEFLASYYAHAFLRQRYPHLATLWQAMCEAYALAIKPTHVSLEDFEKLYFGVGVENYLWYQGKFQQQVAQVYRVKKLSFLKEVKATFPRVAVGVDWKEHALTISDTLQKLEKISPGFIRWAEEFR